MDFKIGECAVYYGRGVGVITGQEKLDPRGNPCNILVLQLERSSARVRADDSEHASIRAVINKDTLKELYEVLKDRDTKPSQAPWNRKYREYVQKIQSGEPLEVAHVLRELELLSIRKPLSFGESKIYSQAKTLVIEEGAYVLLQPKLSKLQKSLNDADEEERLEQIFGFLEKELPSSKKKVENKIISHFDEERQAAKQEEDEALAKKKKKRSKTAK